MANSALCFRDDCRWCGEGSCLRDDLNITPAVKTEDCPSCFQAK